MFRKPLLLATILLLGAGALAAQATQTAQNTPGNNANSPQRPNPPQQNARPDPVDVRIQQALRERDAIIRNLLERVQELENRLNSVPVAATSTSVAVKTGAVVSPPPPAASNSFASVVNNSTYDEAERHASESLDQALIVRGSLLLPNGTFELDSTASYYDVASEHVSIDGFALLPVLVVGDITSEEVRRDILVNTTTVRLGLPKQLQMDFDIPYGYVLDRTVDANNNQTTTSQFGMGDIAAGLSKQFIQEHGSVPDMLASFHFKSTTGTNSYTLQSADTSLGTGFNSLIGSLTAAKTNDPLVFFGSLNYTKSLPAHHTVPISNPSDPSETSMDAYIRPGDAFGFTLGSVLALNSETSMTVGWDQRFTRESKLNGTLLPASYLVEGTLRIGTSYMYAPGRLVDLSFGVGLTPDTPNLQFSVGFPFRRKLWKSY
jgi:hypothetical protein